MCVCVWFPYHMCQLGALLLLPGADDPLPQPDGDVGDVVGAGDGRRVQWGQVRRGDRRPAVGHEVNNNQLLFQKNHKGCGVIKLWKRNQEIRAKNPLVNIKGC